MCSVVKHVRVVFGVAGLAKEQIGVVVVGSARQASRSEGFVVGRWWGGADGGNRLAPDGLRGEVQLSHLLEVPDDSLPVALAEEGSVLAGHS